MARIITVASGKGGVGRTNVSINLAICLAAQGFRTCLFDADLDIGNINILLGLYPENDLSDVVFHEAALKDILIRNCMGIDVIPGSFRNEKIEYLAPEKFESVINCFSELSNEYDFIVTDTSAGFSKDVISFCQLSSEIILVVTPEAASLISSYTLLNVLMENGYDGSVMIVVNQIRSIKKAKMLSLKFIEIVQKYLTVRIEPLGFLIRDPNVLKAVKKQKPFVSLYPKSLCSTGIMNMAKVLVNNEPVDLKAFDAVAVKTKFLNVLKTGLYTLVAAWEYNKNKLFIHLPNIMHHNSKVYSDVEKKQKDERACYGEMKKRSADTKNIEVTMIPLDFEAFLESRGIS